MLAADKLGEQRYAPVMIESALFTFKNDLEKVCVWMKEVVDLARRKDEKKEKRNDT